MFKLDLHTHSQGSPDGGLTRGEYQRMLASGKLDFIAITDHDTLAFAQKMYQELGDQIIVGEEITTADGELIGLYLKHKISAGMTASEAAKAIHAQGGLVYVPHPLETVRKGLSLPVLEEVVHEVDIVETKNGRAVFQNRSEQTSGWAKKHQLPGAASSDAHGRHGWGRTFSVVDQVPTRDNLPGLLTKAEYHAGSPGLRGVMHPKLNRLRKKLHV